MLYLLSNRKVLYLWLLFDNNNNDDDDDDDDDDDINKNCNNNITKNHKAHIKNSLLCLSNVNFTRYNHCVNEKG